MSQAPRSGAGGLRQQVGAETRARFCLADYTQVAHDARTERVAPPVQRGEQATEMSMLAQVTMPASRRHARGHVLFAKQHVANSRICSKRSGASVMRLLRMSIMDPSSRRSCRGGYDLALSSMPNSLHVALKMSTCRWHSASLLPVSTIDPRS